jgi:serine/threonine-protein phosphatase PGAM5
MSYLFCSVARRAAVAVVAVGAARGGDSMLSCSASSNIDCGCGRRRSNCSNCGSHCRGGGCGRAGRGGKRSVQTVSAPMPSPWNANWDMRAPPAESDTVSVSAVSEAVDAVSTSDSSAANAAPTKKKRKARHQIVLIRHGQYESGASDELRVLTALGREQARKTGVRVRELVDAKRLYPIRYVYYSTMARAAESHTLIQASLPSSVKAHNVQPCSLIREGAVCPPSPLHSAWKPTEEEFAKDGARVEAAFLNHIHRAQQGAGESGEGEEGEGEGEDYTTVLVCHGNVIRYFALKALQLPVDAWLRTSVANSSITILSITPTGAVSLQTLGDAGFLDAKEVTFN